DGHEGAEPAEWNHQAEQKEQVVGAVEDVEEPEADESEGRLMPPRIKTDDAGVAGVLEGADASVGRDEPEHRDRPDAERREPRPDRKPRVAARDRRLEEHVQHACRPRYVGGFWKRRTAHVPQRIVVGTERPVGWQGYLQLE